MKLAYVVPDPSTYRNWRKLDRDPACMKKPGCDAVGLQIADRAPFDDQRDADMKKVAGESRKSPSHWAKISRPLHSELDHLREGFVGKSEPKVPFRRLHCHDDIELGVNEHYPVLAIFGGDRLVLPPNDLVVFWAARPHGPIETTPGGWAHGIHVPLPWILQWRLPSR